MKVHFDNTVTGLRDNGEGAGVSVEVVDARGTESTIDARFVIAADGARSRVREWLGVEFTGREKMGDQMAIYFHADLWQYIADKPYLLYWIYNSQTSGALIAMDGRRRWTYNFMYDPEIESLASFSVARAADIVRAAVGDPSLEVDVRSINTWNMQARIVSEMRVGNVFLAGDAAHPLPPTGGQGFNTGLADVHNLAWKLALVLDGAAQETLLDTYSDERLPVARFNVEQSARNAENMAKSGLGGALASDSAMIAAIESGDPTSLQSVRDAIDNQRDHFEYHGQVFGQSYRSTAITDDGSEPHEFTIGHYVPNAHPGSRAPHLWLDKQRSISTLDLFGGRQFTVLTTATGAADWALALDAVTTSGLAIDVVSLGPGGDYPEAAVTFEDIYGIGSSGAVLVRPDGHIAWRSDSVHGLGDAVSAALGADRSPVSAG